MLKASLWLFLLIGAALLATGLVYFSRTEFMPYHAQAVQADWSSLAPNHQGLLLGMLKGLGAGQIIAGVATLLMATLSLRRSARPYVVLLPVVCVGYSLLITYAMYIVASRTPGDPPLILGVVTILLAASASLMLHLGARSEPGEH